MRVAIITESYAPEINGVAHSVLRVAEHLAERGHEPMVVAPKPRRKLGSTGIDDRYPVLRLPSLPLPGYPSVRLALPNRQIRQALLRHRADVVHLASPFVLGAWGSAVASELGIPIVAIYQTDVPGYADAYGLGLATKAAWRWTKQIHSRADLTLAPSTAAMAKLRSHGIDNLAKWQRGVDTTLFHPCRVDSRLRREFAPHGELIVGYIGRLANEKRVELLAETACLPGVRVVVVGDGPTARKVRAAMPEAVFLGPRGGADLARIYASLDIFVHTGPYETFCQTIQEAKASQIPVVAPRSGGPVDLVEHGRTGLLVTPDDGRGIADAVRQLWASPHARLAMGRAGRVSVRHRTWAVLGDELIGHYRTAINQPQPQMAAQPELELV